MEGLPFNFGVFCFSGCNTGGFAERMGYERNIGISPVSRKEVAEGTVDNFHEAIFGSWDPFLNQGRGSGFTYELFPLILKRGAGIESVFDYAVKEHTGLFNRTTDTKETPQLRWQNADPSKLSLNPKSS